MSLLQTMDPACLGAPVSAEARARATDRRQPRVPDLGVRFLAQRRGADRIWEATPGETRSIKGEAFEFCHILDGVVELTEEGRAPVVYRKGDSFIMEPGYRGVWKTIETVRKIYVIVG